MSYYTERHGLRKPIDRTYTVSLEMYSLLFACCEKYYNNIAWRFPSECPDGHGCCGVNYKQLNTTLKFEILIYTEITMIIFLFLKNQIMVLESPLDMINLRF